jgi:hypothetical protein
VNVLLSSSSYPQDALDWRSRFIFSMVNALARRSDVDLSVWAPPGDLPQKVTQATTDSDARWLSGMASRGGMVHLLRANPVLALGTVFSFLWRLRRAYRDGSIDVVHANWLQNALPLMGSTTPALITVLGSDFGLLHVPGMRLALRAMLRQRRAVLAPNAEWMVSALQQAFGDLAEVRAIPFGVDDAWFNLVREPASDGVCHWMAVTRITRAKIGDLFDWGGDLFGPKRQLHLFGPMQEQLEIPAWVQYHGPTHPADLINRWFPQASGLITLSKHDEGRPQIMLEAMAASLPVLASDLPAHRDMVLQDQTGCLVANRTQLVDSLARLEDPTHNQSTGLAARQWVKNTVGTWDDCASRYANVYRDLLGTRA